MVTPWIDTKQIPNFQSCELPERYKSYDTITLGQLKEIGFYDIEKDSWKWDSYDDEQYRRICKKFFARYEYRDIAITPPGEWKSMYLRRFNEIMPKYTRLYAALENVDPLQTASTYGKSRQIFSDFPQTMLSKNQDYASNGNDREYEEIQTGDVIERAMRFSKEYTDIDVMILDELEVLFSPFISLNINGF